MSYGAVSRPWHQSPNSDFAAAGGYPPKKSSSLISFPNAVTDDDEILEQLNMPDFETRLRVLHRLKTASDNNERWFKKFSRKLELFKAFANVLSDASWEIQHQCVKFLVETMKDYGSDLEWCMAVIMPVLVSKIASQKITVRRLAVQALCQYANQVDSVHSLQKILVQYGLMQKDPRTTKEILREIPSFYMPNFRSHNWSVLCDGVTKVLTGANDSETVDLGLYSLEKMLALVGQQEFNACVQNLPASQRNHYEILLLERGTRNTKFSQPQNSAATQSQQPRQSIGHDPVEGAKQFRHGIIPVSVFEQIDNDSDWQNRYNGLERLKAIIESMTDPDVKKLQPHLFSYINLLGNVLDDLSIKVVVLALEILRVTVTKLKLILEPHLQQVASIMGKHFGNQKAVVKQLNMLIAMELMKHMRPKPVVGAYCVFLQHRNSRVKEDTLNIITAALLRFASGEFNLLALAHVLAPLLADSKRRVRLAAFECLSVLAFCMGYTKLEPLYKCVRDIEQSQHAQGLTAAVQAKLAKRQMPKIKYDGLLEYSDFGLIGPSNGGEGANNADVNWIMSAGVGPGSAMSRSLSPNKLRQQISNPNQSTLPPRVLSAGKNRQKLPWENTGKNEIENQKATQLGKPDNVYASRNSSIGEIRNGIVDSNKTNSTSPIFLKSNSTGNQQLANGRNVVLSPIDVSNKSVSAQSVNLSTKTTSGSWSPDLDPNESLNTVKWNAAKKREHQRQIEKSQSVETLSSAESTTEHRKNTWDDMPIKTKASTNKMVDDYYAPNSVHSPVSKVAPVAHQMEKPKVVAKRGNSIGAVEMQLTSKTSIQTDKPKLSPRKKSDAHRPPVLERKQPQPVHSSPPKKLSAASAVDTDVNKPFANPDNALQTALKKLTSEEWQEKVEGLNSIQRLAQYNKDIVVANIHPVIVALNAEAKNLRSSVSKQALGCYAFLFTHLKKNMDSEVDRVCQVLVAKTGDASNAFIRDDAQTALECMVDFVTPQKALIGLTTTGAAHKNAVIRGACAQLIQRLVETMGPDKVLASPKEFVEKLLTVALQFTSDNQPQPRLHGKNTLNLLASDRDFDRVLSKTVTDQQQKAIRTIVDSAKSKATLSAGNGTKYGAANRSGSIRRKNTKLPDEAADSLLSAEKELSSNNWEERFKGINRFKNLCDPYGAYVGNNVKMLETFMQRLNDINSKVALQALESLPFVLTKIRPHIGDALRPMSTEMVKNLAAQLPSKNDDVRKSAEAGLDASIKTLDNSALIQPISIAVKSGNIKQKPPLIYRLSKICQNLYDSKQKLVQMHGPPVLSDLLKSGLADSDVKQATIVLAKCLSKVMGRQTLFDQPSIGPREKATLETIL